jgi:hypothetical protein
MRSRLLCRDLGVVWEAQRGTRLGLGRGGDVAVDRQVTQYVAHPIEGVQRDGFKREAFAFLALPASRIRLHSNWTRVQYMRR